MRVQVGLDERWPTLCLDKPAPTAEGENIIDMPIELVREFNRAVKAMDHAEKRVVRYLSKSNNAGLNTIGKHFDA